MSNQDLKGGNSVTWQDVARQLPVFVAWAVQAHGPLPDGEVQREDYERLAAEYAQLVGFA